MEEAKRAVVVGQANSSSSSLPTDLLKVSGLDSNMLPAPPMHIPTCPEEVKTPRFHPGNGVPDNFGSHLKTVEGASLEHLLAQLAFKEQQYLELENSTQILQQQVQQMAQENRTSKSALKKEKQWQIERGRLLSELDTANMAVMEKEARIHQLERDLGGTRAGVDRVQSRSKEAEREKERGSLQRGQMQAELEDARLTIEDLEGANKIKDETSEKQRRALNDLSRKLEAQKKTIENHLEEARRRAYEFEEMEQSYQLAMRKLSDKDKQLMSLREAHEKLRVSHAGKQTQGVQEREEVINALEATQAKCGEQEAKLREMVHELVRVKAQAKQLEGRCAVAEAEANVKSASLKQVQSELDSFAARAISLSETKEQADVLKMRLIGTENALKQETTQRVIAECALKEYKQREEHLLKVEEGHDKLQEKAKWRNEQFQSLEEAHSQLRENFQESKNEWEMERAGMLREIDSLQDSLLFKERLAEELRSQLQLLHQALAHEESRRKVLEVEVAEAQAGMEHVATEFEVAQSAIESLREKTSTEIGFLRDAASAKERQIVEMQVRHAEFEQEYQELKLMEVEFQSFKSSHEELEQALGIRNGQILALEEAKRRSVETARRKEMERHEERERVLRSLNDAQASSVSKDVKVKELEIELDRAGSLCEHLRVSNAELQQKHLEELNNVLRILELANESLADREQILKERETEVDRVRALLDDAQNRRAEAESQATSLQEQLMQARGESEAATQALETLKESSVAERASLLEALGRQNEKIRELKAAHSDNLEQTLMDSKKQEEKYLHLQSQYRALQQLVDHHESDRKELEKAHEVLMLQLRNEQKAWHVEKETLAISVKQFDVQVKEQDKELKELRFDLERNRDVVLKLEARCALCEQQMAEQCFLAEESNGKLAAERMEVKKLKKEAALLNESFTAAVAAKDASLEKLKERLHELEFLFRGSAETANSQTVQVASLEKRLQEQRELQASMEQRMHLLMSELNERAGELERLTIGRDSLQVELENLQEESKARKRETERQLWTMEDKLSASSAKLKEVFCENKQVTQQLGETSGEKDLIVKELRVKEAENDELRKENKSLCVEKSTLEGAIRALEERKLELIRETESNKAVIEKLCSSLEVAESSLLSKSLEISNLHNKLGYADNVSAQLHMAEEKAEEMEGVLKEARANVQDKEEKLVASEWAVQQLASEISKAKNGLMQKEREEAVLQEQLSDLERQLRGKEGEMIEMECYLENVLKTSATKQVEVDMLSCKMQEVEKGAAEWKKREIDLETELNVLKNALEDKMAALTESESAVKRASEVHYRMEGAIESLKLQLAAEEQVNSSRQSEMEQLCQDLERTKQAARLAGTQLKDLQGRLQQLEQSSKDRIQKSQMAQDELHHELSSVRSKLEISEKKMEKAAADLERYEDKCADLLDLIGKKDEALDDMEANLASAHMEMAEKARDVERGTRELNRAREQIQSHTEIYRRLDETLNTTESQMRDLELCKQQLEFEVRQLKKALDIATRESASKNREIEGYRSHIEQLEEISVQHGEAHALISRLTGELQATSSAVHKRDSRLSRLQSCLIAAQSQLRASQDMVAMKETEKDILAKKQSVAESQLEQSKRQMSQMQQALEDATNELKVETEKVLFHVAAMKEKQAELEEWKEKAVSAAEDGSKMKRELECSLQKLQDELLGWEERAEDGRALTIELKQSMQLVQSEMIEWKEKAIGVADEGMNERQKLECALEVVQTEVEVTKTQLLEWEEKALLAAAENVLMKEIQMELAEWKGKAVTATEEGRSVKAELECAIQELQAEVVVWRERAQTAAEEGISEKLELQNTVSAEQAELGGWKETAQKGKCLQLQLESSFKETQTELQEWKEKALAVAKEIVNLKLELDTAMNSVADLTAQLELQKGRELFTEKLNKQLERDLLIAREEALKRKEKMLHILAQLESTHSSQKELQAQLQTCGPPFAAVDKSPEKKGNGTALAHEKARRSHAQTGNAEELLVVSQLLEDEVWLLKAHAQGSQSEACRAATDLEAALSNLSGKNLVVRQLKLELSRLRSSVSKLELEKGATGEGIQALPVAEDGGEPPEVAGRVVSQEQLGHYLELCDTIVRKNIWLQKQVDGLQRRNRGPEKQVEGQVEGLQSTVLFQINKQGDQSPNRSFPSPKRDQDNLRAAKKRNVESPRRINSATRLSIDAGKSQVLGEVDENSPMAPSTERCMPLYSRGCPPLSPSPVQLPKRSRRGSSDSKTGELHHLESPL